MNNGKSYLVKKVAIITISLGWVTAVSCSHKICAAYADSSDGKHAAKAGDKIVKSGAPDDNRDKTRGNQDNVFFLN
jgi:hypothetical protein